MGTPVGTGTSNTTYPIYQQGADMSTTIWIVVAVVAVLLIVALGVLAVSLTNRRRQRQAEQIREQARLESAKLERREALAQETAAKARAAQAEAEVKAAEADQAARAGGQASERGGDITRGTAGAVGASGQHRSEDQNRRSASRRRTRRGARALASLPRRLAAESTTQSDRDGPPPQRAIPVFTKELSASAALGELGRARAAH